MVRIKQVVNAGMLADKGISKAGVTQIMNFVEENKKKFYHLSLRLVHQIALCFKSDNSHWQADVAMTKMRAE